MSDYDERQPARPREARGWSVKEFLFYLATDQPLQEEFLSKTGHERTDLLNELLKEDDVNKIQDVEVRWTIRADVKLTEDAPPDLDPTVTVTSFLPTW
jgi:hypothetical protein